MTQENKNDNVNFSALPCLGRCISTLITTTALSIVLIFCMAKLGAETILCVIVGAILLSLNIFLAAKFATKLNTKVTVTDSEISQKQYSRIISVKYDAITKITVKFSPLVKTPPLVTIFSGDDKISFDTTSKVYDVFKKQCQNESATAMLRKALKEHFIYD